MIRLFVGGIKYETDEERLRQWFEERGYVVVGRVQVVRDPNTGHSRGFGFVDLDDEPSISFNGSGEAEGLHQERLDGRSVTIRQAHPKKPREARMPEGPRDRRPRDQRYED